MSAHTPGPWFSGDELWACITTAAGGRGGHLATCTGVVPPTEQRANARLMAAAPDLLEALEAVMAIAEGLEEFSDGAEGTDARRMAEDAIARARGGK